MQQANVKKNLIYNTLYQTLNLLVPLITAPYMSRLFGADGIGVQSYVGSIAMYFSVFAQLGTQSYGQREIAMCRDDKEKASRTFWGIEVVSIITTLISLTVWGGVTLLSGSYMPFFIVYSLSIINVAFDVSWFFIGYEQFKIIVIRNLFIKTAIVATLFGLCHKKSDLLIYIALTCLATFLGSVSLWPLLRKRITKISFKNLNLKRHFTQTLVYFIPTIATNIYMVLDKIMIGVITDRFENGYYEQTTKITNMAIVFVSAINGVMYPRMSHLFAENKKAEMKAKFDKSINFILFLAIPMVLGLMVIANDFIPAFFGPGYDKVVDLLRVYCILIVITAIGGCITSQYLVPIGKRKESSKVIVVGTLVNLGINLCLIPILKSMGAVIASIISEILILILFVRMSKGFVTWTELWKATWKRLIAGLIMAIILIGFGFVETSFGNNGLINCIVRVLIQVSAGALIYFLVLLILRDSSLIEYGTLVANKVRRKE